MKRMHLSFRQIPAWQMWFAIAFQHAEQQMSGTSGRVENYVLPASMSPPLALKCTLSPGLPGIKPSTYFDQLITLAPVRSHQFE